MGLTALAGARLGARVVGLDYEWPAVAAARRNQDLNRHALPRHHGPLWVQMDWRSPGIRPGSLAFVWGGDVVYEKRFIRPVADFLDLALARDGVAWLAEPGRNFNRELCETLAGRGWNCGVAHEGRAISRDAPGLKVDVSVWELRR
jgi:predicted nicotinamide N-methyase